MQLADWSAALDVLVRLGEDAAVPVVLDEFSYLVAAHPPLPSLLQAALSPARRRQERTRFVVCGFAVSLMSGLLTAQAPLRGRAGLELVVHAFDYRTAARFWRLDHDPVLAFQVFAVVGGTPAYAREFVGGDAPSDADDFERWLTDRVLDPASPLFREGRVLLAEDPELAAVRDRSVYYSVLAAVANGHRTAGRIAAYVQRRSDQLAHPLAVLTDAGFLHRDEDPLRRGRPQYRVAEPIVRFHHAVMRSRWAALQRRAVDWPRLRPTLRAQVVGPAFEELCRTWVERFASAETVGGTVEVVGHTVLHDPSAEPQEVDVVVVGTTDDGIRGVLAVGEARSGERMTAGHIDRLRRVRARLGDRAVPGCRLLCFSGAGFGPGLADRPPPPDVVLVDFECLYRGD